VVGINVLGVGLGLWLGLGMLGVSGLRRRYTIGLDMLGFDMLGLDTLRLGTLRLGTLRLDTLDADLGFFLHCIHTRVSGKEDQRYLCAHIP
jgi:hypothetical protein